MNDHRDVRIANVADLMRVVQDDCQTDALALDSTPFTPRGVAEALGATLAMIGACARSIEVLAEALLDTDGAA